MKRFIVLFTILSVLFCMTSCELISGSSLKRKMVDYYSNDENYVVLEGTIISLNKDLIEIKYTNNFDFSYNLETGYGEFIIIDFSEQNYDLKIGDTIVFSSAPKYFYNGQRLPIVSIEKDNKTIMSFEEGKSKYMSWIQNDFKAGVF